jgi:hypothetical protein
MAYLKQKNVVTGILAFDFELFIGVLFVMRPGQTICLSGYGIQ